MIVRWVILLLHAPPSLLSLSDGETKQLWEQYKKDFSKSYSTYEDTTRLGIFAYNWKEIKSHNERFNAGLETYTMGLTKFTDLTPEEFERHKGYKSSEMRDPNIKIFRAPVDMSLPESIDYRDKGAVNPVKNQGQCGSCWAFGTVGSLESIYYLKTKKLYSLSEQMLIDCRVNGRRHACSGGNAVLGFDFVKMNGIESEESYPYVAHGETCKLNRSKVVVHIKDYVLIEENNEVALQAAVATKGPVAVIIDATALDPNYKGGIIETKGPYKVNHVVVVIGYGKENGTEFWLVRNSWGPHWGENGYFRVARNKNNQMDIASEAVYPVV